MVLGGHLVEHAIRPIAWAQDAEVWDVPSDEPAEELRVAEQVVAHDEDRRDRVRTDARRGLRRRRVAACRRVERRVGEPAAPRIGDRHAPAERGRHGDQRRRIGTGAADHEVRRRQDRVEDAVRDPQRPPGGDGRTSPDPERGRLLRLKGAPFTGQRRPQEARLSVVVGGTQRGDRLRGQRRRLRDEIDDAAAAQAAAPHLVALRRVVDGDCHRDSTRQCLACESRGLLLQAAAADDPHRRRVRRYEEPGARPPVRGAAHGDDRGEGIRLAARLAVGRTGEHGGQVTHRRASVGMTDRRDGGGEAGPTMRA